MTDFRDRLSPGQRRALDIFEYRHGAFGERERRQVPQEVDQLAATGDPNSDAAFVVKGHAAVFNRLSLNLGGFREKVAADAFNEVLDATPLVHFNWDHDMGRAMASTDSQEYLLELRVDPRGLFYYAKVAPVSYANDLRVLMKGGVIKQASFAFTVAEDTWEIRNQGKPNETIERTILRIGDLFDVTVTAQGAYPQTDSQVVRSYAFHYAQTTGRLDSSERDADPEAVAPTAPEVETPEEPAVGASEAVPSPAQGAGADDPSLDSEGGDTQSPDDPVLRAWLMEMSHEIERHRFVNPKESGDAVDRGAPQGA